jgi:hypothetical protein
MRANRCANSHQSHPFLMNTFTFNGHEVFVCSLTGRRKSTSTPKARILLGYDYPRSTEQARVGLLCSPSDFTQVIAGPMLKDKLLDLLFHSQSNQLSPGT